VAAYCGALPKSRGQSMSCLSDLRLNTLHDGALCPSAGLSTCNAGRRKHAACSRIMLHGLCYVWRLLVCLQGRLTRYYRMLRRAMLPRSARYHIICIGHCAGQPTEARDCYEGNGPHGLAWPGACAACGGMTPCAAGRPLLLLARPRPICQSREGK
jgi:hypothetical protein